MNKKSKPSQPKYQVAAYINLQPDARPGDVYRVAYESASYAHGWGNHWTPAMRKAVGQSLQVAPNEYRAENPSFGIPLVIPADINGTGKDVVQCFPWFVLIFEGRHQPLYSLDNAELFRHLIRAVDAPGLIGESADIVEALVRAINHVDALKSGLDHTTKRLLAAEAELDRMKEAAAIAEAAAAADLSPPPAPPVPAPARYFLDADGFVWKTEKGASWLHAPERDPGNYGRGWTGSISTPEKIASGCTPGGRQEVTEQDPRIAFVFIPRVQVGQKAIAVSTVHTEKRATITSDMSRAVFDIRPFTVGASKHGPGTFTDEHGYVWDGRDLRPFVEPVTLQGTEQPGTSSPPSAADL